MTALVQNPSSPLPLSASETPGPSATAAERSTSEALQQKQADEHWERWLDKGIRRDQALRRRFQVIGGVLAVGAAGAAVWLALAS